MLSVSNFHLLFNEHMTKLCENSRSIATHNIKLQLIEVRELDVCGSLVLSNLSHNDPWITYAEHVCAHVCMCNQLYIMSSVHPVHC